jgi:hypothetical protein
MKTRLFLTTIFLIIVSLACNIPLSGDLSIPTSRSDTETPKPSATDTVPPPSTTWTPTPDIESIEAEIYGVDWLATGDLLITIQTALPIERDYYLLEGDNSYNCRVALDSNRLLFCAGKNAPPGNSIPIKLIVVDDDTLVFEGFVQVPYLSASSGGGSQGEKLTQMPASSPGPTSPPAPTSPPPPTSTP